MPQQLDIHGHTKEEEAIEFLRQHEPPEGYTVCFSGGKDSIVVADLTAKSGVKHYLYHALSGIDPPQVIKFIKKNYKNTIFLKPKKSFFELLPVKGYPTKMTRWCCDALRKEPFKNKGLNHRLIGVRAEESSRRSKFERINNLDKKTFIYRPIFFWDESEIWDYIDRNGLKYPKLYDEGFGRTGCVVCPFMCNSKGLQNNNLKIHKEKYSGIYRAFERAMLDLYENRDVFSFEYVNGKRVKKYECKEWFRQRVTGRAMLFEEFLDNWYRGK